MPLCRACVRLSSSLYSRLFRSQPFRRPAHRSQRHTALLDSRLRNHQSNSRFTLEVVMKRFLLRPLMILVLALGASVPVLADTIRLKDGSILRGEIVSFKNEQFTILVGSGARGRKSRITVYMEDVDSIEFDNAGIASGPGDDNNNSSNNNNTQPTYQPPTNNNARDTQPN